ncbi:MAG: GlyGly-CTERM sorting domain-containing protein [Candidatus Accumulibacter meliphilus]|uniref:GlyGly-CTERM sorting domain-containing protein n=1 Tax=Candidatus Accumulibacter meliphilus TaxID=2211374 RepID=A0A369XRL4_9PROT|nr:MAG: GlyGly-CTERM sorting domain-containing protein [Candidatus Accumulibacter meliphilus]
MRPGSSGPPSGGWLAALVVMFRRRQRGAF